MVYIYMRGIATHIALDNRSHRLLNPDILLFVACFPVERSERSLAVSLTLAIVNNTTVEEKERTSNPNPETKTTSLSQIDDVHPDHRAFLRLQVRLPPPLDRSMSFSSTAWPWVSALSNERNPYLLSEYEHNRLTGVVLIWSSIQEKTVFVGYTCDSHAHGRSRGVVGVLQHQHRHQQHSCDTRQQIQVKRPDHGIETDSWSF